MNILPAVVAKGLLILGMMLMCLACSDERESMEELLAKSRQGNMMPNMEKICGLGKLRVLAVGNSYTWDGTAYLQNILSHAGVDGDDYSIYLLTADAASLGHWSKFCTQGQTDSLTLVAGNLTMPVTEGTMAELFAQNWDVIVFQQVSRDADDYYSYNPALGTLLDAAKANCTNGNVAFAWHLIHSYGECYQEKGMKGEARWMQICLAARCVMAFDGFDILIPSGTAIQYARSTSLNTEHDLTRDGTHLAFGVGRYISACTWAEALFAPAFGFSVTDNKAIHNILPDEASDASCKYADSCVPVTDINNRLCQQCARHACVSPYKL